MNNKKKSAFSLIELSIVIIIIGILIAGLLSASNLIAKSRLKTARSLTQSSPVASIKDLAVWYETTLEKSFKYSEQEKGTSLTAWNDINPQVSHFHNALLTTNSPTYEISEANGLPVVRFSNTANQGFENSDLIIGGQMTVIAVASTKDNGYRRIVHTGIHYYIGLGDGSRNFAVFYGDGIGTWNHLGDFGADAALNVDDYYILSATLDSDGINTGYVNGVDVGVPAVSPETKPASTGIIIGSDSGQNWYGDIAEIIIYNRSLKKAERQSIEEYLSQKWSIEI